MLERIGVTFAASQECSKLAIGMFCVLFMLLGILQLHLSSENGHFFRHDASKTLLNPRFGAPNPQICFRKISKITKKIIFRYLLFFGSMMSKDSPRPLKAFKSAKMCPIQSGF